jgi:hypothetical protein
MSAVPIGAPGRAETLVTLDAGTDVHFWVNVHPGDSAINTKYEIELVQNGRKVADANCAQVVSEQSPTCSLREVSYGDRHLTCSLECTARVPQSGPTLVRASVELEGGLGGGGTEPANLIVEQ